MGNDRQQENLIAERAAEWVGRLPQASLTERREFVRWLRQSPLHVNELLVAAALDADLSELLAKCKLDVEELYARNNVTQLVRGGNGTGVKAEDAAGSPANKPRTWKPSGWIIGLGFAASLVALAVGWPGIIEGIGVTADQYETLTGEQRSVPLTDGSVMHLNTESEVRVSFSEKIRDIYLERGQATFDVAHDTERPFRVHAGHALVQAVGTQFDVHRETEHTDVAVIEGVVKVTSDNLTSPSAPAPNLPAGKGIRIAADGRISDPVDVKQSEVTAWRSRRLVFRNHTLHQIAAEFNRYNKTPKILVEGESLQGKRYSGVFDANDPESFLLYLAHDQRLAFDRSSTATVVIRMRTSYAYDGSPSSH